MTQSRPIAGLFLLEMVGEELSVRQDRGCLGHASRFMGELSRGAKLRPWGEVEVGGREGTERREMGSGPGKVAGREEAGRGRERKDTRSCSPQSPHDHSFQWPSGLAPSLMFSRT